MSTKDTPRGSDENLTASTDSFWDVRNYKRTVKRIDDGSKLCDEFMKLVTERAEIEARYSAKLKAWAKKWEEIIKNGPEYGSMEEAMKGTVNEANSRANVHTKCREDLMENVYDLVKKWKAENFHKSMFNWKEVKDAEEGFARVQKPWEKLLIKVNKSKKAFHNASKATEQATKLQNEASSDTNVPQEKFKKYVDAVEKARKEMQRCEDKYRERLDNISKDNPRYERDMAEQFDKCQAAEQRRLEFFKDALLRYHRCLDISQLSEFSGIFLHLNTTFQMASSHKDLEYWSVRHGTLMPKNWPQFEVPESCKKLVEHSESDRVQRPSTVPIHLEPSVKSFRHLDDLIYRQSDRITATQEHRKSVAITTVQGGSSQQRKSIFRALGRVCHSFGRRKSEGQHEAIKNTSQTCKNAASKSEGNIENTDIPACYDDQNNAIHTGKGGSHLYCSISQSGVHQSHMQDVRADPCTTKEVEAVACVEPYDPDFHGSVKKKNGQVAYNSTDTHPNSAGYGESDYDQPREYSHPSASEYSHPSSSDYNQPPSAGYDQQQAGMDYDHPSADYMQPPTQPEYSTPSKSYNHVESTAQYYDENNHQDSTEVDDNAFNDVPPPLDELAVPVQALYDYEGQEEDELSFKAGDIITKLTDKDDQGWCRGRLNGKTALFPAEYVEAV